MKFLYFRVCSFSISSKNDNVKRRIKAFEATSLPSTSPNVERWMIKNAMHCIVWIAKEIDRLKDHVDKQEPWYEEEEQEEDNGQETIEFCSGGDQSLFNVYEVKNMNVTEALPTVGTINTTENVTDFIHKDV